MTVTAAEELRANLWPICDSRLEPSLPDPALIHGDAVTQRSSGAVPHQKSTDQPRNKKRSPIQQ
jgi:hypothetical protein